MSPTPPILFSLGMFSHDKRIKICIPVVVIFVFDFLEFTNDVVSNRSEHNLNEGFQKPGGEYQNKQEVIESDVYKNRKSPLF